MVVNNLILILIIIIVIRLSHWTPRYKHTHTHSHSLIHTSQSHQRNHFVHTLLYLFTACFAKWKYFVCAFNGTGGTTHSMACWEKIDSEKSKRERERNDNWSHKIYYSKIYMENNQKHTVSAARGWHKVVILPWLRTTFPLSIPVLLFELPLFPHTHCHPSPSSNRTLRTENTNKPSAILQREQNSYT